jgi:hypothetical protein
VTQIENDMMRLDLETEIRIGRMFLPSEKCSGMGRPLWLASYSSSGTRAPRLAIIRAANEEIHSFPAMGSACEGAVGRMSASREADCAISRH